MKPIVAVSTPVGAGAISIVRMSGDGVLDIARRLFSCKEDITPRKVILGTFSYNGINEKCLLVYFKAPHSYTGEDIVEFQCHGGELLTREVLNALINNGARLAENGEFTKRAFLNGKVSLDSAEGIIDVINAGTESELKAGYNLMSGKLYQEVKELQDKVTDELASVDMTLDYPEHDDEGETLEHTKGVLKEVEKNIQALLATAGTGKLIKSGINAAIVGKPNVGKSSLLNALLGEDRAIVTDVAGTTRDTITESIAYKGIKINFVDTAGVRDSENVVEKIGIDRSKRAIDMADIVLLVLDSSEELTDEDRELLALTKNKPRILVLNKSDKKKALNLKEKYVLVSAKNGVNIEELKEEIFNVFAGGKIDTSGLILTNVRHIEALSAALEKCRQGIRACEIHTPDIVSFTLKELWQELGKITGETETESIIDAIFSKFCLGK